MLSSFRRATGSAEAVRPSEQAQNLSPVGIHHHATRHTSSHTQLGEAGTRQRTVVVREGSISVSRQAASRACEAGLLRTTNMPVL